MHVDAGDVIARRADRTLDGVVVALAAWTAVFHLARLTGVGRDGAFGVWLAVVVAVVVALVRSGPGWAAPAGPGSAGRLSRALSQPLRLLQYLHCSSDSRRFSQKIEVVLIVFLLRHKVVSVALV